jgi:hypothetical protein
MGAQKGGNSCRPEETQAAMDNTISSTPPIRPDVVSVETTPRPTPPRVPFSDVLAGGARSLVQSAQSAAQSLPGSPLMALAIRPGASIIAPSALSSTAEGPGGATGGTSTIGSVAGQSTGDGSGTTSDQSMQSTMAQDQQMNLYYLQIQEQVNAQNRTFSALSNVMEVEHNTAKTAIGNIH